MEDGMPPVNTQESPSNYSAGGSGYEHYSSAGMGAPMEFSVGSVISRSFSTLFKNPILFFGLAILAGIPGILMEMFASDSPGGRVLMSLLGTFFGIIFQGAVAYGVYRSLRGEGAGMGDALARGMARFLPLLGISIIMGFGIGIGVILLIIPGLILSCIWAVTVPACVVEHLGVTASLSRSSELTKGYRWKVFGLLVCIFVIAFALSFGAVFIFTLMSNPSLVVIGAGIVAIIPAAFQNVMIATIYYDLRAVKEGVTVDSLANVFD